MVVAHQLNKKPVYNRVSFYLKCTEDKHIYQRVLLPTLIKNLLKVKV